MKRTLFLFLLLPIALFADSQKKISVNNRVLAIINGKGISVVDLMKKMDMILYQNYPQYLEVPEARFQFYMTQWKTLLAEMTDRELVLLDAEDKKFEVSSGDVREELEEIFGPQVMINLDSVGLTQDEAWKLLKEEIIIRRMLQMQVRAAVFSQITPSDIRSAYDEYVQKSSQEKECTWSCITVKSTDIDEAHTIAQTAYTMLTEDKTPREELHQLLKEKNLLPDNATLSNSTEFTQKTTELASNLQELFLSMKEDEWSKPQQVVSKATNGQTVRLYFLHKQTETVLASIEDLEASLREELVEKRTIDKTKEYYNLLSSYYHISKDQIEKELPENFQPF